MTRADTAALALCLIFSLRSSRLTKVCLPANPKGCKSIVPHLGTHQRQELRSLLAFCFVGCHQVVAEGSREGALPSLDGIQISNLKCENWLTKKERLPLRSLRNHTKAKSKSLDPPRCPTASKAASLSPAVPSGAQPYFLDEHCLLRDTLEAATA